MNLGCDRALHPSLYCQLQDQVFVVASWRGGWNILGDVGRCRNRMGNRNPISGDSPMTSFLKIDTFNHQIPPSPPGFQNCISKEALMCTMRLQIKTNGLARSDPCFLQPQWFNKASAALLGGLFEPCQRFEMQNTSWIYQNVLPLYCFFRILDELQYLEYHEMTFREKPIGFAIFEGKIQGIFYCNRWGDGHLWSGRNGLKVHWKNAVRPK